jgi:hypothetical protein
VIPVINSANKGGTQVEVVGDENGGTANVTLWLAELKRCRCGYQARVPRTKKTRAAADVTSGDAPAPRARSRKKKAAATTATT